MLYQFDVNFRTHTSKLTHVQALAMQCPPGACPPPRRCSQARLGVRGLKLAWQGSRAQALRLEAKVSGGGTDDAAGGPGGSGAGTTPAAHINTQNDH